jgi:predicted glycosyltransferase involved in capsule biosynthesis
MDLRAAPRPQFTTKDFFMNIYIPYKKDFSERERNLKIVLNFILNNTDFNIIVGSQTKEKEIVSSPRLIYFFNDFKENYFNKCKLLNDMFKTFPVDIFCIYDCDIIIDPIFLYMGIEKIKNGVDCIIPYDGSVYNLEESNLNNTNFFSMLHIKNTLDISNCKMRRSNSMGGVNMFNSISFKRCGMMNENFKNWGAEDDEIYHRILKLSFNVERLDGKLLHLPHPRNKNNSIQNEFYKSNNIKEFDKVKKMSTIELQNYINTFKWK